MPEWDEDRPSISGRKISSNIPSLEIPGFDRHLVSHLLVWIPVTIAVLIVLVLALSRC